MVRAALIAMLSLGAAACAGERWPDPPAIDPAAYQAEYEGWRRSRQEALEDAVQIVGLWPIADSELSFGADPGLSIVLPAASAPPRAGVFRREGDTVTVVPAAGSPLRLADGARIDKPLEMQTVMDNQPTVLALGSLRFQIERVFEAPRPGVLDRRWVSVWDEEHPALKSLAPVEAYPLDPRWRLSARFDAFAAPKPVKVADVRGGSIDLVAVGQLVFRLNGEDTRLTAFGFEGSRDFFVMFTDPTNATTTYAGYRMVFPEAVEDDGWTVLDFNFASNPPCAYSRFTTCPLPPPENRLRAAVEAGEKRHPSGLGYTP